MSHNVTKTIYYCWFGGNKPQSVIDCINNWKEKLQDYKIVEINEHNKDLFDVEKECENNLWFKIVWKNKMWAYVSDYARLKVLYEHGGVYFDTDITVEKDITELLEKNKLILGWEDKKHINGAVIITPAKNEIIEKILNFYDELIFKSSLYTIPNVITFVLKENFKLNLSSKITEGDLFMVLPPEYFYPLPPDCKDKDKYITENSYTVHWWDSSWVHSNIEYFLKNKHKKDVNKLQELCFAKKCLVNNPFLRIEKVFTKYSINFDFYYFLRFKYIVNDNKIYLALYIMGIAIRLFKVEDKYAGK